MRYPPAAPRLPGVHQPMWVSEMFHSLCVHGGHLNSAGLSGRTPPALGRKVICSSLPVTSHLGLCSDRLWQEMCHSWVSSLRTLSGDLSMQL